VSLVALLLLLTGCTTIDQAFWTFTDSTPRGGDVSARCPYVALVDVSLISVVAKFNRCNRRKLKLKDEFSSYTAVSGRFHLDDVEEFVQHLALKNPELSVMRKGDQYIVRKNEEYLCRAYLDCR
jgi:hypothetical protein